jgi:uncharacterized protein involved in exopolysaccharide biosynthesis
MMETIHKKTETSLDEIDLMDLMKFIWNDKIVIILTTSIFAIISVVYALSLPNIYSSEALLAPNNINSGSASSQISSQIGGLASLAGMNLGSISGGQEAKINTAIEILGSRQFFKDYLYEDLLVEIMAAKSFDNNSQILTIDDELYDTGTGDWLLPNGKVDVKPTVQKTYNAFIKSSSISKDKFTGFVTVSYNHISPIVSQKIVDRMVKGVNQALRKTDIDASNKSIIYLMQEIKKTSLVSLQQAFSRLIEEQTKTMMLANLTEEYIFRTIDPPVVSELKSGPSRSIICIVITFIGGLIAILISFFRFSFYNKKNK